MNFPIHTILYAKGWYKHRGDVDVMWMDLIHTIYADGWSVFSKKDVAQWCLHRYDELKENVWGNNSHYGLYTFFKDMAENRRIVDTSTRKIELDELDYIIWTFLTYLNDMGKDDYGDSMVRPSEKVLPLNYHSAYFSEPNSWNDYTYVWHPAEMRCDVQKRIDDIFGDTPEAQLPSYLGSFEEIEGRINGAKVENIVVLNGTDSLNECREIVLYGKDIGDTKKYDNLPDDKDASVCLDAYYSCVFEHYVKYVVRYATFVKHWDYDGWNDEYMYHIKSIRKYNGKN